MSDKPLIQQALAADLADLMLSINPKSAASGAEAAEERDMAALGYLRGFWECICREWQGIDRLRYVTRTRSLHESVKGSGCPPRPAWHAQLAMYPCRDTARWESILLSYTERHQEMRGEADSGRIDKFYMLIRRFVNASFRLLQRSGWKAENIQLVNRILQGTPAEGKQKARAGPLE